MLTVGELAARTGVATSALRFYEERGLIHSTRTPAGHRRYPRGMTRVVAFIVFAQRVGLSLEEIKMELDTLPVGRPPRADEWARLSATWSERIAAEIEALHRLWMPLARALSHPQSGRSDGVTGRGTALLDGRRAGGVARHRRASTPSREGSGSGQPDRSLRNFVSSH